MTAVTHPRTSTIDLTLFRGGRSYLWLTGFAFLFGIVSLLSPSSPSYDPFSWLIWGREILHGHLQITGGSSWKPLPVIFTTVFALFGSAQPDLWLIVARAGAALTVLMSAKLTIRIVSSLVSHSQVGQQLLERGWRGRALAALPVLFAGVAVLVCTTFTPHFPGDMMLGYSEGLMTAAFLIAVERAWDGHHRQAFALGLIPCLDRPEVWPVWAVYGVWLMWRDRGARRLVIGLAALMLALWLVPQKLGGHGLFGFATHARVNRSRTSSANSSFPFWSELDHTLRPLVVERLEFATLLMIAFTAYLIYRAHRQLRDWRAALHRYPAAVAGSLAGIFGFFWWFGIAVETQAGFAGNPRYAVIGVMFVCIGGCVTYGWACIGLATVAARGVRWLRQRSSTGRETPARRLSWLVAPATLVIFAVFAIVPDSFTGRMPTVSSIRANLNYQAHLRNEIAVLIARGGGPQKVMGCGSVMAHNLQVTMVAWDLDVPIPWIQALPTKESDKIGPNVVFQDGPTSTHPSDQGPTNLQMQIWENYWKQTNGSHYTVLRTAAVTLYMDCSTYSHT